MIGSASATERCLRLTEAKNDQRTHQTQGVLRFTRHFFEDLLIRSQQVLGHDRCSQLERWC